MGNGIGGNIECGEANSIWSELQDCIRDRVQMQRGLLCSLQSALDKNYGNNRCGKQHIMNRKKFNPNSVLSNSL